jgi:hypothetical protein
MVSIGVDSAGSLRISSFPKTEPDGVKSTQMIALSPSHTKVVRKLFVGRFNK